MITYIFSVMHNAHIIIRDSIRPSPINIKVMLFAILDILPLNFDMPITIPPRLLMVKTKGVSKLM